MLITFFVIYKPFVDLLKKKKKAVMNHKQQQAGTKSEINLRIIQKREIYKCVTHMNVQERLCYTELDFCYFKT
jgi:hypothetical protein